MFGAVPDATMQFFSNMDIFWLLMAFAGGAFGALIGGNYAFGFTGVTIFLGIGVLAATGNAVILDYVSFGPVFGPHIAFAGGAAAAAYAATKGDLGGNGKDINTQLAGLSQPDVIFVGALFGVGGYIVERLVALIPWFGGHTDTVALTVTISGIVARLMFGKKAVFHAFTRPKGDHRWLDWQEKPSQVFTIGLFSALFASGISMMVGAYLMPKSAVDDSYALMLDNAHVLPFAISAITIFFLAGGLKMPVTHHITITASIAALTFFKITENGFAGIVAGVIFGLIAAYGAELWARWTYDHGDTHIDPPAGIIWPMNTLVMLCAMPFA